MRLTYSLRCAATLARSLLRERSHIPVSDRTAALLSSQLTAADATERRNVLRVLNEEHSGGIGKEARLTDEDALVARRLLAPSYCRVLTALARSSDGIANLLRLRVDSIRVAEFKEIEAVLAELLGHYFTPGLLSLDRITWSTSCSEMEEISRLESVHRVRRWSDIKRRVGPRRRCFVLRHASLGRVPLVILHCALLDTISSNVQEIINEPLPSSESLEGVNTVVFYSITATQRGLAGIDLGHHMISRAVASLTEDIPQLTTFATLSPIPGFLRWLENRLVDEDVLAEFETVETVESADLARSAAISELLNSHDWSRDEVLNGQLRGPLLTMARRYLLETNSCQPPAVLCPVGNFHMRNGAEIFKLNWLADRSSRGLRQSAGLMVNYLYPLSRLEENRCRYLSEGVATMADSF